MRLRNRFFILFLFCLFLILILTSCSKSGENSDKPDIDSVPEYSGEAFVSLNNNIPFFNNEDFTEEAFESYSEKDYLNRCGVAFANIGYELMPTEERGAIGQIKPSGWQISKYDFIDGKYLYNRCHLIGFQLTGENANEENLITGTRYMNVEGMLPFENEVADYIRKTNNHVLYRVTPVFEGINLIASGVIIEAMSVEDEGEGICFNVYCYNVQPGVKINYKTGSNSADTEYKEEPVITDASEATYIANKNSMRFHKLDCDSVNEMKPKNKVYLNLKRDEAIKKGYIPCGSCKP